MLHRIVLARLMPFDSLMDAALWDLIGIALWAALAASLVLTGAGIWLWSPRLLALAATLSLAFSMAGIMSIGGWTLLLTMTQVVMAIIVAWTLPKWAWPLLGILGVAGWFVAVRAIGVAPVLWTDRHEATSLCVVMLSSKATGLRWPRAEWSRWRL